MKRLILALCLIPSMSYAADLPVVKAQPRSALFSGYPYTTSGIYFGFNTMGGGGSVEASGVGVNPNSVVSNSAAIGGTLGYVWNGPNAFYALELMADWQNFNGNSVGFSFGGPFTGEVRVKVGTPLSNVLSFFPNLNLPPVPPFPPLPNGQTATNIHPYFAGGYRVDDISVNFGLPQNHAWRGMPTFGVGAMGQLSAGLAADVWTEVGFSSNSICTGFVGATGGCGKLGNQIRVGLAFYY